MRRTLLVTNDFPPRVGGIQSYLAELASRLPNLVVYASSFEPTSDRNFDASQPFEVIRHPSTLMLPTPAVAKRATELAKAHDCDTVWFGAAAPLALLAPRLRRAGVARIVASTHGHEVGWSMAPGGRQALRGIGGTTDIITYVSRYTRSRFASAFGPLAALEYLPSGVNTDTFTPDATAGKELRKRYGIGDRPVIVCVSRLVPRKGQDALIQALADIRKKVSDAMLVIVGTGHFEKKLRALAQAVGVAEHIVFTGAVPESELPAHYNIGDVFAMPCRTRGRGLDVEGLGIVYLEASATGLPVVAGQSGGAPETVREGVTGTVVDGRNITEISNALIELLTNRAKAEKMGRAGRRWVTQHWQWDQLAAKLTDMIN